MAVSTGIDIVQVSRIKNLIEKQGDVFIKRIFSEEEIRYCLSKARSEESFAARFAAKEAFYKAYAGAAKIFSMNELEIISREGAPELKIAWKEKNLEEPKSMSVSLSHEKEYAIAIVLIEI